MSAVVVASCVHLPACSFLARLLLLSCISVNEP